MIKCSFCKLYKPGNEFYPNSNTRGFSYYCKDCSKNNYRKNYLKDKKLHYKRTAAAREKRKLRNHRFILNYFLTHPCVDCEETDPIVLEFDHLDNKKHCISDLIRHGSQIEKIQSEIAKCEVVCCNCHRRRTAKRGNWYNYAT